MALAMRALLCLVFLAATSCGGAPPAPPQTPAASAPAVDAGPAPASAPVPQAAPQDAGPPAPTGLLQTSEQIHVALLHATRDDEFLMHLTDAHHGLGFYSVGDH